jgi:VCBS repeat-containing protein
MAQYPATIDLSRPDSPNTGSDEAFVIESADLDGAVTEANGNSNSNRSGGLVTWTYEVAAAKVEYLAAGEQRIEAFDATVKNGDGRNVTRTVSVTTAGTNDGVTLANVDLKRAIAEALGTTAPSAQLSDSGTVAFADVDVGDAHSVSVSGFNAGANDVGAALGIPAASPVADTTNCTGGSLSWTSPSILMQWNILRLSRRST